MLHNCACQKINFGSRINVFISIFKKKKELSWRNSILLGSCELRMNGCPTPHLQKEKRSFTKQKSELL